MSPGDTWDVVFSKKLLKDRLNGGGSVFIVAGLGVA